MAAKKKAATAPKKLSAKKASPRKKKQATSSAPGEAAEAHKWLMQSQGVSTEGLPESEREDDLNSEIVEVAPTERTVLKDPKTGQFLPGNKSGGRKKGSRVKMAAEFFDDFYGHWLEGDEETGLPKGRAAIEWVYKNRPDLYFNGAIKILPQQVDVRVSEFAELKEEALDAKIEEMAKELSTALAILKPGAVMQ